MKKIAIILLIGCGMVMPIVGIASLVMFDAFMFYNLRIHKILVNLVILGTTIAIGLHFAKNKRRYIKSA